MASILIIDDDEQFSEQVARLLQSAGHHTVIETNGTRAIEAIQEGKHHLLILDIMLPDISGFEVCRRIRRDTHLFMVPIVMLSSMSSEEEVLHGLAQGADDYVTKPCDPQNLLQRVTALLRIASEGNTTDALTQLPSGDHTKRELQRRMVSTEPFALAYFELLSLREFAHQGGHEARCKAIRHLGRALQKIGEHVLQCEPFVGHMGSGHFVCLVDADKAVEFGESLRMAWLKHLEAFYQSVNLGESYTTAMQADGDPLLDVLCCITRHHKRISATPQAMFETISQIRQRALATRQPGIYLDQRESDTV